MNLFGKSGKKPVDPFEPIPAGEVVEGNEESDWAAWEDSVAFQDSQMPDIYSGASSPTRSTDSKGSTPAPHDPFASVSKNSA